MNPLDREWNSTWNGSLLNSALEKEIHIWRADLDLAANQIKAFAQLLSLDERERADRFYFEHHQRRFVVARGMLRSLLGCYLDRDPCQIEFCYGSQGKPALALVDTPAMHFNVSHSEDLSLYAIAQQAVGIDVERVRSIDAKSLAQRFFSPREYAWLTCQPIDQWQPAFLRLWTGKEAVLKATGEGLAALGEVEISFVNDQPVLLTAPCQPGDRWVLHQFVPASGYVATLAFGGCHEVVKHFDCSQLMILD